MRGFGCRKAKAIVNVVLENQLRNVSVSDGSRGWSDLRSRLNRAYASASSVNVVLDVVVVVVVVDYRVIAGVVSAGVYS
jgi:hypothetical protein